MNEAVLLSQATALINVILIDIVLAGDNAVVVGTAAAGLPPKQQRQVIFVGSTLAFVARVIFALLVVQLLLFGPWLIIAGGLLLLWVAWKMWRDTHGGSHAHGGDDSLGSGQVVNKTFASAITQVAVADISMSLDNVLAVAGAARDHPYIMVFGLVLSIALMAVAAGYIARLIDRYRWIAYVGIIVIVFVAGKMIWEGVHDVMAEEEPPAQSEPVAPAQPPS